MNNLIKFVFLFNFICISIGQLENAFTNVVFDLPVDIQNDGTNNWLYIVEQSGIIKVIENKADATPTEFLNIQDRTRSGGEMGLLGLAFDPNYADNGYFYTYRTQGNPNLQSVISRFSRSTSTTANKDSELEILRFNQPFQNHNGGQISFGPDGYLYIASGDGGSGSDPQGNGQNLNTLLGKMLRIDVSNSQIGTPYTIPTTNPFTGANERDEIFAYGLRNPWRFSFDSKGNLWAGDVGQDAWEEIDIVPLGGNMGWKNLEGTHCFPPSVTTCSTAGTILPVFEYPQVTSAPINGVSVTGGFVYEGSHYASIVGKYVFADFGVNKAYALTVDAQNPSVQTTTYQYLFNVESASTFGVDINKELYVASHSNGRIYRLNDGVTTPNSGNGLIFSAALAMMVILYTLI